jgi:DNA-binding CsgD family transcriptional regulator
LLGIVTKDRISRQGLDVQCGLQQAGRFILKMFSRLIGDIYDTVINPDAWPEVLANITDYVGGARGILILEDAIETTKSVFYVSFSDPDWVRSYLETYLLLNPMRLASYGQIEAGTVILTSDLMTPEEYARSRFASEFLSLRQMVDLAVVVLEATATTITVLSIARNSDQGIADESVRRKLAMIGPHVRRAATISRVLNRQRLDASTLSDTLDVLDGGIFLLDAQGTILHSNLGAQALLADQPQAFALLGGRVWPADLQARAQLDAALVLASAGDDALGTDGLSIIFGSANGRVLVGTVMSLMNGSRQAVGGRYRAVAALVIRELHFDSPASAQVLRSHYGLTQREMAVVAGVVELGGVPQIASVMGLTSETIKSHLKSIYRKTGTTRQADLVKLVAGTASPFRRTR